MDKKKDEEESDEMERIVNKYVERERKLEKERKKIIEGEMRINKGIEMEIDRCVEKIEWLK